MESSCFYVNESPRAFWDWELKKRNIDFIRSINPDYFNFIVENNLKEVTPENEHNVAILMRQIYSQSLELLFALLCSVVQAPTCTIGWMLSYSNYELIETIKKIDNEEEIRSSLKIDHISWQSLSNLIFKYVNDNEKKEWVMKGFSTFWSKLAKTYINDKFNNEYNIIKHGLRFTPGGFDFKIQFKNIDQKGDKELKSIKYEGSKYGTSYFLKEKISKYNYRLQNESRNWDPIIFSRHIQLITQSINNILAWIEGINLKSNENLKYSFPYSKEEFVKYSTAFSGMFDMSLKMEIKEHDIKPFSKEKISKLVKIKNDK